MAHRLDLIWELTVAGVDHDVPVTPGTNWGAALLTVHDLVAVREILDDSAVAALLD